MLTASSISSIDIRMTITFLRFSNIFFNDTATTNIYTLSLHDALPIWPRPGHRTASACSPRESPARRALAASQDRSEEHTSELQSQFHLVCRLLLEKKNRAPRRTRRD